MQIERCVCVCARIVLYPSVVAKNVVYFFIQGVLEKGLQQRTIVFSCVRDPEWLRDSFISVVVGGVTQARCFV